MASDAAPQEGSAAFGSAPRCRSMLVYCDGIRFGFVRFAPLLAVILCWGHRCFGSCVLLGILCLVRVTLQTRPVRTCGYQGMCRCTRITCLVTAFELVPETSDEAWIRVLGGRRNGCPRGEVSVAGATPLWRATLGGPLSLLVEHRVPPLSPDPWRLQARCTAVTFKA